MTLRQLYHYKAPTPTNLSPLYTPDNLPCIVYSSNPQEHIQLGQDPLQAQLRQNTTAIISQVSHDSLYLRMLTASLPQTMLLAVFASFLAISRVSHKVTTTALLPDNDGHIAWRKQLLNNGPCAFERKVCAAGWSAPVKARSCWLIALISATSLLALGLIVLAIV